jgi:glycine betaine/choline ABC-type transport system substrate-binding protein
MFDDMLVGSARILRATPGILPRNDVRQDAEHYTQDACAPRRLRRSLSILAVLVCQIASAADHQTVIGSKKFTESYVLAEIAKRVLKANGVSAEHRQGMGGTIILWQALRGSQIDAYPEYTGTITQEILKRSDNMTFEQIAHEPNRLASTTLTLW